MSDEPMDEFIKAWTVREGNLILMPDHTTWCTVEKIQRESDTGLLFIALAEGGFTRPQPDEYMTVRRDRPMCVNCDEPAEGNRSIHLSEEAMWEFGEVQVPLCDKCGSRETPTCESIWERLRSQGVPERRGKA